MNIVTMIGAGLKVPLQRETETWLARCPVGTRTTYWQYVLAVNAVVTQGKRDGWLARLDHLWLTAAPTPAIAALDIVSAGPKNLIAVNAPVFAPYVGYLFDGASNYLDPAINLATANGKFTQDDASLFQWDLNEAPGLYYGCGATSATGRASLRFRNGQSALFNANCTTSDTMKVSQCKGLLGWSRTPGGSYLATKSNTFATFNRASTGLPVGPFYIGKFGSGSTFSKDQVAITGLGGSVTQAHFTSMYAAFLQFLIAVGAIADDNPPDPQIYGSCSFPQSCLAELPPGVELGMQTPPPPDDTFDNTTYALFPMTRCTTQAIDQVVASTRSDIKAEHFIWGDRERRTNTSNSAFPNPRPNLAYSTILNASGQECRFFYSSRAKARAAWIVKQRYSAGALARNDARYPDGRGWLDVADAAGYDTSGWANFMDTASLTTDLNIATGPVAHHLYFVANPQVFTGAYSPYRAITDAIYLPLARAVDSKTIIVDSFFRDTEDQTTISPTELLSTVREAADSCHATGHKLTIYPNAINGAGAKATGFDASVGYQMTLAADRVGMVAWPQNFERNMAASLANQKAILTDPATGTFLGSKVMMIVGIGALGQEMTDADAMTVYNFWTSNGIKTLNFWRDYAVQGGPPNLQVNRVISIAAFGHPPTHTNTSNL